MKNNSKESSLKLDDKLKMNILVLFITVGISVYGFETYLEFFQSSTPYQIQISSRQNSQSFNELIEASGVQYDHRNKTSVIKDLYESGIKAYPNISPIFFWLSNGLIRDTVNIYPLGGISNHTTVYCNENGYWVIFQSDEHGFNNPNGLYDENKLDIVLIGDSFVQGACVNSEKNIGAVLRETGFNVISVGMDGNGVFLDLASLIEYAEPLKPKIVLWFYHSNDLNDLSRQKVPSFLRKYLDEDDFSQNLMARQEEIDSVLINYFQDEFENYESKLIKKKRAEDKRNWVKTKSLWANRIIKLYNIRSRINMISFPTPPSPIFKDILEKSKQKVSEWGGELYFVYLPDYHWISTGKKEINYDFVIRTVTELDIPIIDIYEEVFSFHSDPLSLFPFRQFGHYTADGYQFIGEVIEKRLRNDKIISLYPKN